MAIAAAATVHAQSSCDQRVLLGEYDSNDRVGAAIAISDDTMVVGAPGQIHRPTGLRGTATVLVRGAGGFGRQAVLTGPDATGDIGFGRSVAIDGDTIVVGAPWAIGTVARAGAAYVFVRSGTTWTLQAKVFASDGARDDGFGGAVAVSGGIVLVGSPSDDDVAPDSGSAYLYTRRFTSWNLLVKLRASDPGANDGFGRSVSVSGTAALVGAPFDDDLGMDSGSVYVFAQGNPLWYQTTKLRAPDGADRDSFGHCVALRGDTALIGVPYDDDRGTDSGAGHVFASGPSGWVHRAKLLAPDGAIGHRLGGSAAIGAGEVVLGAPGHGAGAAYTFTGGGISWSPQHKLVGFGGTRDEFGFVVGLSTDRRLVVVGAPSFERLSFSLGAAYAHDLTPAATAPFGSGCRGSNQLVPLHTANGRPILGRTVSYAVGSLRPQAPAVVVFGASNTSWNGVPLPLSFGRFGGDPACHLLVDLVVSQPLLIGASGNGGVPVALPAHARIGSVLYTQVLAVDIGASAPLQLVASNGLHTTAACR